MVEYNKILTDPFNPIIINNDIIKFPSWLSNIIIKKKDLPKIKNTTENDQIISIHSSFYDATIWYPWIIKWTPKSIFMELNEKEINDLIYEHNLSKERQKEVEYYLNQGYNFIKSSKKSSHLSTKVLTYENFIEEITHPNIIISFKKGCKHIFFREFIENIGEEYRIYIFRNEIRYIEEYIKKDKSLDVYQAIIRKINIIDYVIQVMKDVKYQDYILDIGLTSSENSFLVIEINTPLYLFGGLHLSNYLNNSEKIHKAIYPIFRYKNEHNDIMEI